jgi:lipopolysaccharide biosynthesis glycosyltransferase
MFCFNNEYAIAAAVAFRSLLENASKEYFYKLYVLHTDVSLENQRKLHEVVIEFKEHASLEFLNLQNRFEDLWGKTIIKGHYSKEGYYKLLAPSLFPQYETIIISDVDLVFLGDVSVSYFSLDAADDIYVAGVAAPGKILHIYDVYKNDFSQEEISKMVINSAYMVYNLDRMRKDSLETSLIKCVESNYWRVRQLDQDVINLCCYPKIKFLPLGNMMCNYVYDLYKTDEDFDDDKTFSRLELKEAMQNPIVLHYPGARKPWKDTACTKADEWLKYVAKTPFCEEFFGRKLATLNQIMAALTERTAAVAVRDGEIVDLKQAVLERDCKIATAEQQLRDCFHRIKEIEESHSWRITAPYRAIGAFVRRGLAALLG